VVQNTPCLKKLYSSNISFLTLAIFEKKNGQEQTGKNIKGIFRGDQQKDNGECFIQQYINFIVFKIQMRHLQY
jgi:hypothetical protein